MFEKEYDRFGGVLIRFANVSHDWDSHEYKQEVQRHIEALVEELRAENIRGVWFTMRPMDLGAATILNRLGFRMYHAWGPPPSGSIPRNPEIGEFTMHLWLPDLDEDPDVLPNPAHTLLGVGGLVLRENDDGEEEVLVVQEKFRLAEDGKQRWKFPGGAVDPHERLCDAVEREVWEETSIRVKFKGIVNLRHGPEYSTLFGDFYIVCLCEEDGEHCEPCPEPHEIAEARWMTVSEIVHHPDVLPPIKQALVTARALKNSKLPPLQLRHQPLRLPDGSDFPIDTVEFPIVPYRAGHTTLDAHLSTTSKWIHESLPTEIPPPQKVSSHHSPYRSTILLSLGLLAFGSFMLKK